MSALDDLLRLGLDVTRHAAGSYRLPCPRCAKNAKEDTFGLTVEPDGASVWHCYRCSLKGGFRGCSDQPYQSRPSAAKATAAKPVAVDRDRLSGALTIWRTAQPILPDDAAGCYLQGRGCAIPPAGSHLRWIDRHRHYLSGHVGPALIALATHAVTSEPMTLHQTWIDPTRPGQKAPLDKPRLLYGGLPKAGAIVRLWPDEEVLDGLAIGEGIETCLAAAHGFTPIWSTLDAGNMATFPVLPGIEALTVVADHDEAGLKAANTCATIWTRAGREVRVWKPSVRGEDAADFVARVAA